MANRRLLVFGASGHAKDVISLARELGYAEFVLATTDVGEGFWGIEKLVIGDALIERFAGWDAVVAIGDNGVRRKLMSQYSTLAFVSLIAPSAVIGHGAAVACGSFVGHHVYVGPDSEIGAGVILNVGAVVGHDCLVGDYVQLGPRAVLLGHVSVGDEVFLGASSVVNRGAPEAPLTIASRVSVGMGCVVTQSVTEEGVKLLPKSNVIRVG